MKPPAHRPAGIHLLADFHGIDAGKLVSCEAIDTLLRSAAQAAGATILHSHFHSFGPQQGVTGVLLLAESHISIHTWPEFGFAAADIFMCGRAAPNLALEVIDRALQPEQRDIRTIQRGVPAFQEE
ncbi:MAG: adenosylmethionine decarboxylase [Pseudomonadota bacterium]|nr:adenosylmethionine decarboxylase [Pseudomonadota bacterium]